jgi:hypothetical protein
MTRKKKRSDDSKKKSNANKTLKKRIKNGSVRIRSSEGEEKHLDKQSDLLRRGARQILFRIYGDYPGAYLQQSYHNLNSKSQ